MTYIWERTDWTRFRWNAVTIEPLLRKIRMEQGKLLGSMEMLGFPVQQTKLLHTLTEDIQKSSEIEGENLSLISVRSSVARRLGIDIGALPSEDRHVAGIVELILDATRNCGEALTEERLCGWQASLLPTGHSGIFKIAAGTWRTDSEGRMKVISGSMGKEKVHYLAPPADRLQTEMTAFLLWFNSDTAMDCPDLILKSALAHLWFVTIHPFDDGNGRIARAIADLCLARADGTPDRYYSMSAQIRNERNTYYQILERTQKGDGDITEWLFWYLECLEKAIGHARGELSITRKRDSFWERVNRHELNARQRMMITRLLEGFEGKLTSSKWAALAKCSQDTAGRDIEALVVAGFLRKGDAGGRSTWYDLIDDELAKDFKELIRIKPLKETFDLIYRSQYSNTQEVSMNTVIVSTKYQVVIPKEIREDIGLKAGTSLEIINYGNRIELIPIQPMKNLKGIFKGINTTINRDTDRL